MMEEPKTKKPRGFAAMSLERRREIARMGGSSVPPEKRTFSTNKELARKAGFTGGKAVRPENRTFARNPGLAASAGRAGGLVKQSNREKPPAE